MICVLWFDVCGLRFAIYGGGLRSGGLKFLMMRGKACDMSAVLGLDLGARSF